MLKQIKCCAMILAVLAAPGVLLADDLTTSSKFLCSVNVATVCHADGECEIGMPWTWLINHDFSPLACQYTSHRPRSGDFAPVRGERGESSRSEAGSCVIRELNSRRAPRTRRRDRRAGRRVGGRARRGDRGRRRNGRRSRRCDGWSRCGRTSTVASSTRWSMTSSTSRFGARLFNCATLETW